MRAAGEPGHYFALTLRSGEVYRPVTAARRSRMPPAAGGLAAVPGVRGVRGGRAGSLGSRGSGGGQVGADVVVAESPSENRVISAASRSVAARWNSDMPDRSRSPSTWPRSLPGEANARCVMPCVPASRTRWAARERTCWSVTGGRCGGSASGWLTVPVYRPAAIPVGAIVVRVGGSARRVAA